MPKSRNGGLNEPMNGLYIPMGLVIFGTLLVQPSYTPYAVIIALSLGAFKVWRGQPRKVLKPTEYQDFELLDKTVLTHNTAIYRFGLPRPNDILGLPVGQHITVAAAIDGKEISRSYTPTSSDNDKGHFDLLIKSYPTGNISRYIESMKLGQTIRVKGPKGQMRYENGLVKEFGMIAGGTGITPMLQIVRAILNNPADQTKISLIFANVNEEDILLREDLDELAKDHAGQFRIKYVLNNPPEGWTGGVGFVTQEMIKEWCPGPELGKNVKILLCGPPPMVGAMKKAVVELGYEQPKVVSKLEDQVFSF
ncbi:NADH-cytochrome b5 reductase [Saitoella coloradoensis]